MKRRGICGTGIAVWVALSLGLAARGADSDPYAPLRLYGGNWVVTMATPEKKTDQLENHCAQTGLFFSCEQVLNGKSSALVVFLPVGKTTTGAQEYRTQGLMADASAAGEWGKLVIDGDTWMYSWESGDPKKRVQWRNTNHFAGKDKIHFEVQNSEDGTTWKTQLSGDEERKK